MDNLRFDAQNSINKYYKTIIILQIKHMAFSIF